MEGYSKYCLQSCFVQVVLFYISHIHIWFTCKIVTILCSFPIIALYVSFQHQECCMLYVIDALNIMIYSTVESETRLGIEVGKYNDNLVRTLSSYAFAVLLDLSLIYFRLISFQKPVQMHEYNDSIFFSVILIGNKNKHSHNQNKAKSWILSKLSMSSIKSRKKTSSKNFETSSKHLKSNFGNRKIRIKAVIYVTPVGESFVLK